MDNTKKCSSKNHEKYDAIIYCQNCNIYLCNKCSKTHSEWFQTHNVYNLNNKKEEIFTIYCQEKYHSNILEFYCKNHNVFCCAACISKINDQKYGQHSDCDVCSIEEIKEDKKSELNDNIEKLEELLNNLEKSLSPMSELFQKANEDKEKLKMEVQRIFTVIRKEVNKREDKILSDIDEIFEQNFFKEELIKESKNLPKKAKKCLEKGKIIEKEKKWDTKNNNLISIINDCIDIEKNIFNIEQINEKIEEINSKKIQIKFVPFLKDSLNDLIKSELNYSDKDDEEEENKEDKEEEEENKEDKEEINKNIENEEEDKIETIKIIFLGAEEVGKSSILNRLYNNSFDEDYQATIGQDFHSKDVTIKNRNFNLLLYDTSGQQKFKSLIPMYIRDSKVIIFVYDISNKDSFIYIKNWYNEIKDLFPKDAILILIGNKTDLEEKRQIKTKEAEEYSKQKGFLFYELSSKIGDKIVDLLENIIFPEISKKFLSKINTDFINRDNGRKNEIKEEKNNNKNNIKINEEMENEVINNEEYKIISNQENLNDLEEGEEEKEQDKDKIETKKEKSNINFIKINKKENDIKLNEYLKIINAFGHLENKILKNDYRILLLGLDYSGKTTILYRLKSGEAFKTIPTVGFNVESFDYKNANLTIWDVGGADKLRVLWKHYFQNTDGFIYVVDLADRDRIDESYEELIKLLKEKELKDCPILIFANKQDLNGALSPGDIYNKFEMEQYIGRKWLIQGASGKTGQGLKEGLDWLIKNLIKGK